MECTLVCKINKQEQKVYKSDEFELSSLLNSCGFRTINIIIITIIIIIIIIVVVVVIIIIINYYFILLLLLLAQTRWIG